VKNDYLNNSNSIFLISYYLFQSMKKIIKIILSLLLVSFILPIIPVQAAGSAIMRLISAKTDYYVGDTIYVDIMVEPNGAALNTVRAILDYTSGNVISINDFSLGTAWPNQSPGRELNNSSNHINVGGFVLVDSVNSNSLFGTLIFKASQVGSSTISFAAGSHLIAVDQTEQIDLSGCQGITINVIGAPPPPPPANLAPVFQPVGNKQINLGETVSFHLQAADPDDDIVNLNWNIPADATMANITNNASIVYGDFNWTPQSKGVFTTSFVAVDDSDLGSKSSTLTVSIGVSEPVPPQNHQPVFDPIPEKTVNAGETLTFNITATDPDNDNIVLSLEPLENATLNPIITGITSTSRFSWAPTNSGIYYAVFKALDNNITNPLSSNLSVRVTVFGGQCPPCGGGSFSCPLPVCAEQNFTETSNKTSPIISSPSHPEQNQWYANNQPQFAWQVADEGLGYTFNLDQNPLADPSIGYYSSQDKLFAFSNIADGFWYFHLKVKYIDGWGPTAHYQVKIDTSPPEFFKPSIETGILADGSKQYKLYFSALDKSSGVAYYEMKIDNGEWQKAQSPYVLNESDKLGKILSLRAVDNAGNAIEAYIDLQNFTVINKEPATYNLIQPAIKAVAPPFIDHIIMPEQIGRFFVKNVLMITGRAEKNSLVTLHLAASPEIIVSTKASEQGLWMISLEKILEPGRYTLYAIASINGLNSEPSEQVSLTLKEKFVPRQELKIPWWFWLVFLIILLFFAALLALRKKIIKKGAKK